MPTSDTTDDVKKIPALKVPAKFLDDPKAKKAFEEMERGAKAFRSMLSDQREQERKDRTRRLILIGTAVERRFSTGEIWDQILGALDDQLIKQVDRALFPELKAIEASQTHECQGLEDHIPIDHESIDCGPGEGNVSYDPLYGETPKPPSRSRTFGAGLENIALSPRIMGESTGIRR